MIIIISHGGKDKVKPELYEIRFTHQKEAAEYIARNLGMRGILVFGRRLEIMT